MRVTQIEVSYRLTESAEFNNVQVERRVTMQYPAQGTPQDPIELVSITEARWQADKLKDVLKADCEADVDDWLEAHGQPPRYYRRSRYVIWQSWRMRALVILPLRDAPALPLDWSKLSPEAGMRLAPLQRYARAWVTQHDNHDRWLLCTWPGKVAAFLAELPARDERGEDQADDPEADAVDLTGDEWDEDIADEDPV